MLRSSLIGRADSLESGHVTGSPLPCSPRVLFFPVRMIMVPPRHYCVVINPVARDDANEVIFDTSGQAKLRHADLEIRQTQDPFPLYPGEEIQQVCVRGGP